MRVDGEYLRGQLRSDQPLPLKYHVREESGYFYRMRDSESGASQVRRHNVVVRDFRDKRTGLITGTERLLENDALVCYDPELIQDQIL